MTGQIMSDSHVTVFRSGSLDGAVDATGFTVEKGGCFQGELTIRPRATSEAAVALEETPGGLQSDVGPDPDLLGGDPQPALG